jgi:hypothetical protein
VEARTYGGSGFLPFLLSRDVPTRVEIDLIRIDRFLWPDDWQESASDYPLDGTLKAGTA